MRLVIEPNRRDVGEFATQYVVRKILSWQSHQGNSKAVFGLCVSGRGHVMSKLLDGLVQEHKKGVLSFHNVAVFATDEFIGLDRAHPASQHYYFYHRLFKHTDILRENVHLLDGNCGNTPESWREECDKYERAIVSVGGLDLVVTETGYDGSIGRNFPGSSLNGRTRAKALNYDTAVDVAEEQFDGEIDLVPKFAFTIGLGTLFEAQELVVLFSGIRKAHALENCTERDINHMWPCSFVQKHPCCLIICDESATNELRVRTVSYFKGLQRAAALTVLDSPANNPIYSSSNPRAKDAALALKSVK